MGKNRLTVIEEKCVDIPGGYKVKTTRYICGCVETIVYGPTGGIYRTAKITCVRHGGEQVEEILPGQLDIFTGLASVQRKKKKGK